MWGSDGDTAKAGTCARVIAIGCAKRRPAELSDRVEPMMPTRPISRVSGITASSDSQDWEDVWEVEEALLGTESCALRVLKRHAGFSSTDS
jgi:hypothetical protein